MSWEIKKNDCPLCGHANAFHIKDKCSICDCKKLQWIFVKKHGGD